MLASSFVHLRQDHVAQIVNHAGVRAGEVLDKRFRLARPGEHQRSEFERRGPAFGFGQQGLQVRRREVSPEAAFVELSGFRGIKLQLLGSELEQLASVPEDRSSAGRDPCECR